MKDFFINILVFVSIPFYIVAALIITILSLAYDMAIRIGEAIR